MQSVTKLILIVPESTPLETVHRIAEYEGFKPSDLTGQEHRIIFKIKRFEYTKPTNPKI